MSEKMHISKRQFCKELPTHLHHIFKCFSIKSIRAGWVMPGVASPPLKFFFRNYPPPENFWIHLGPKTIPWDTFQAFQVYPATPGNCQVYPGVSRCIQKKIFPAEGRKNFFLTGWAGPPLKNFFRKKKFFFSHLYLFMLE